MANKQQLTPEMARSHIDDDGTVCPICGESDIEGNELSVDGGVVTQDMECSSCKTKWFDVYRLVGICDADGNRIEPTPEPKKKVYICVSGGLVSEVYAPSDFTAVIIDDDNGECDEKTEAINKELKAELAMAEINGEVVALDQN